jgi:hypothetical protein
MEMEELFNKLAEALKYTSIVYYQSSYSTNQNNFDNVFVMEYGHTDLPDDGLLFFVPSVSSNDSGACVLKIKIPYLPAGQSKFTYTEKILPIIKETNDGKTFVVGQGDIIANRMCIFRFKKNSKNIILINSPLYNSIKINSLKATDAEFINVPTVYNPENAAIQIKLVTSVELEELKKRVTDLENKIIFGTEDPEAILSDKPTGTIYIQVEEN